MKPFGATLLLLLVPCAFAQSSADLTIRDAKLPTTVKSELAKAVINELSDLSPIDQKRIAYDTWVTFLRLNPSALPAILLSPSVEGQQHLCAPSGNGNCSFWLFQQSNGHIALLLDGDSDGGTITVAKTSHNGLRDVITHERSGHTPIDVGTTIYHFDGKSYREAICSELIEGGDENDTQVKVPPHPCNTTGKRIVSH